MPASDPFDFNTWFQNDGDIFPPASTSVYGGDDFHGPYRVERYLWDSTPDLSVVAPTHPIQQPDAAAVGGAEDSGAVQTPATPRFKEIIAKAIGKSMWTPVALLFLALVVVAYAARNSGTAVAGLSVGELISIELILFLSGLMSGLSGFGFSAVGAGCLLFIEPITQAPLLQTLSTCNQFLSLKQLREDMPKSWKAFWEGPGFCILGGMPGAFVGIWMLSHLPAEQLMKIFGVLLILYSIYSMFRPAGAKIRGLDGPVTGAIVGFIGGAIGGFTAFPGP
ncbi:MAG: sulfite exporter TauE/SafE family protein, partial [Verrucomicrobia bacterium]|nr:sulfite exporter TauE/SafE family protein [Verrucomicrobiota bacterium]